MAETIVLDPSAVAVNRTQLDITTWVDADPGINWGDAAIQAYMADQQVGSSPVDYRLPNRQIQIPLNLRTAGATSYSTIRLSIQQKAAIFQAEGGQILRQIDSTPLYADVVNATLHLGGSILAAFRSIDVDAVLTLECLPDWYGTEVTLDTITGTGVINSVLTAGGAQNLVPNPSFEYDTVGAAPVAWATSSALITSGATITVDNTFFVNMMKIVTPGSGAQEGACVTLPGTFLAGTPYTFQVTVQTASGTAAMRLTLGVSGDTATTTFTATTSGVRYTLTWTPASNRTSVLACITTGATSATTTYVDRVRVDQEASASTYFDGDTLGYTWLGTRGNSTTRQAAAIAGNYPGRVRIIAQDTSGNDQKGMLWGFRARYYNSVPTRALLYEAETMTPVNGAAGTALSGASGGTAVYSGTLPAGSWMPMLSTQLTAGSAALGHQGTYRVWARAYSATGQPQMQLLWGPGGLAVPITNDAVQLAGTAVFQLLDLGQIRIDAPPIGANTWQGAIRAYSAGTADTVSIDAIYLQPLDETAGKLAYTNIPPASSISATKQAGAGADNNAVGTVAWTSPNNVTLNNPSSPAQALPSAGQTTHYLKTSSYGFALPSTATVVGIQVAITRLGYYGYTRDANVQLVKATAVQTTNKATGVTWRASFNGGFETVTYGGPTDLWGTGWLYSDVNNSGFGVAVAARSSGTETTEISSIAITVYYTLASGFTVAQDAVVYAGGSKFVEIRTEGPCRTDPTGVYYAPVSNIIGDLPRIPPSRLEARSVELFVKPTRGDLNTLADSGLDAFSVQVKYRPSFLFVGA